MKVKEHYDNHLAHFYSWMLGDFETAKNKFKEYCAENSVNPKENNLAIDLGAGNGIQTIALAQLGFKVKAVDFNEKLLSELELKIDNYPVQIINSNFLHLKDILDGLTAGLIVCCGDSIAHLASFNDLNKLLKDCYNSLADGGKLLLSFRDYSHELKDTQRFIPVKSDENRILTCVIDYSETTINVTDLLHEKEDGVWKQKVSSYQKLRISPDSLINLSKTFGFSVMENDTINGMIYVIFQKK